jgi:uncharacterized protein YqgC (DUF456 family)
VVKSTFEALSLPNVDGAYYLRPDLLLGCFLIDPDVPLVGGFSAELIVEADNDRATRAYLDEVLHSTSVSSFAQFRRQRIFFQFYFYLNSLLRRFIFVVD